MLDRDFMPEMHRLTRDERWPVIAIVLVALAGLFILLG